MKKNIKKEETIKSQNDEIIKETELIIEKIKK